MDHNAARIKVRDSLLRIASETDNNEDAALLVRLANETTSLSTTALRIVLGA